MSNRGEDDHPCRPLVGKNKISSHLGSPYPMCHALRHIGKDEPFFVTRSLCTNGQGGMELTPHFPGKCSVADVRGPKRLANGGVRVEGSVPTHTATPTFFR